MEPKSYKVEDTYIIVDNVCKKCQANVAKTKFKFLDFINYYPACSTCGEYLVVKKIKCLRTNHSGYTKEDLEIIANKIIDKVGADMNDILFDTIIGDLYYNEDIPSMMKHF